LLLQTFKLSDVCDDPMLDSPEQPDLDKYYNILGLFMASRLEALQLTALDLDLRYVYILNISLPVGFM
jgi:hypothetical protein